MSIASQTQRNKDNLILILSASLTISVLTNNQVNIKEVFENITVEFVKEEYQLVGLHMVYCERQSSFYFMPKFFR